MWLVSMFTLQAEVDDELHVDGQESEKLNFWCICTTIHWTFSPFCALLLKFNWKGIKKVSLYMKNHQRFYCCSDKRSLLIFDTQELLTGWRNLIIDWSSNLTHQYRDFSIVPVRCRHWCHFKHSRPWVGSQWGILMCVFIHKASGAAPRHI